MTYEIEAAAHTLQKTDNLKQEDVSHDAENNVCNNNCD